MKADIPEGLSLRIVVKGGKWNVGVPKNWNTAQYNNTLKIQEFTVTKSGESCDLLFNFVYEDILYDMTSLYFYIIEYYENGATTPTKIKKLYYNPLAWPIYYDAHTGYGNNILSDGVTSVKVGQFYSMAARIHPKATLKIVLKDGILDLKNEGSWTYNYINGTYEFTSGSECCPNAEIRFLKKTSQFITIEYYERGATTPSIKKLNVIE